MSDERAGRKASWSLMADVIQPEGEGSPEAPQSGASKVNFRRAGIKLFSTLKTEYRIKNDQ